jgi:5-methylcytosine-specific restriction enzyme subunit McrC
LSSPQLEESRVSTVSLTQAQADALRMVGRALRSRKSWWGDNAEPEDLEQSERTAIRVDQRPDGDYDVVVYNAVGVIGLPDLQLVIGPKIPMNHLLYLFASSSELPANSTQDVVSVGNDANLFELVARWFLDASERLLRLGLDRDYERRTADLAVVRGRVDLVPTVRAVYAGRPRVRCTFDSFTEDTSLNRTLKAAARAISASLLLPLGLRFRGRRIAERLNSAGELRPEDVHVLPDRNRPHYRDAHQLAALILKSTGIEVSHGGRIAQTFLLRTPEAVEEGIRCALNEHLPKDLAVKRGGKELVAGDASGSKKRRVTPDIVFGADKAVGDVKYMITNGDVITAHLYQVTTFATAYGVVKSALIGFGAGSVGARVEVGKVSVRGFSWKTTEVDPRIAAAKLASEVTSWLWAD